VIFPEKGVYCDKILPFSHLGIFIPRRKKTHLVTLGVNVIVPTPTKVIRLSIIGEKKFKEVDQ
jgi:hypothetical protein